MTERRVGRSDLPGDELPEDLATLIRTAVGWMHRRLRTSSADDGLSYGAVSLINRLRVAGPQRLADLAEWEGSSEPAMGQQVARLIDGGYAERDDATRDVRIRATDRGVAAATRWIEDSLVWLRTAVDGLSDAEREDLRRASEILIGIARS